MLPRFHPACFPWKTILIHMMITESPCRIRAAPRWSSVMPYTRIFSACNPSLWMYGQLTVLFNALSTSVILPHTVWLCQEGIGLFIQDSRLICSEIQSSLSLACRQSAIVIMDQYLCFPPLLPYRTLYRLI